MWAPCRRCAKCLLFRRMRWIDRATNEIIYADAAGRRTWFVTLTISPVHMAGILSEATATFGEVTPLTIDAAAYQHVRKYLDRLRKALKTRLRYFAALERGEAHGRTHYHLLVHEVGPRPLLRRPLHDQWRSFVECHLVKADDPKDVRRVARYVAKYATKTDGVRIRASQAYGHGPRPGVA